MRICGETAGYSIASCIGLSTPLWQAIRRERRPRTCDLALQVRKGVSLDTPCDPFGLARHDIAVTIGRHRIRVIATILRLFWDVPRSVRAPLGVRRVWMRSVSSSRSAGPVRGLAPPIRAGLAPRSQPSPQAEPVTIEDSRFGRLRVSVVARELRERGETARRTRARRPTAAPSQRTTAPHSLRPPSPEGARRGPARCGRSSTDC